MNDEGQRYVYLWDDKVSEEERDKNHEAAGAMIHRGLVEERTNTRDYHGKQKEALDVAKEGIATAAREVAINSLAWKILSDTHKRIEEILK